MHPVIFHSLTSEEQFKDSLRLHDSTVDILLNVEGAEFGVLIVNLLELVCELQVNHASFQRGAGPLINLFQVIYSGQRGWVFKQIT